MIYMRFECSVCAFNVPHRLIVRVLRWVCSSCLAETGIKEAGRI